MKIFLLLSLSLTVLSPLAYAQACMVAPTDGAEIGDFCSLAPLGQSTQLLLPEGYRFQLIAQEGQAYTEGGGLLPGRNDFAGFVPLAGSSERGYLSINHENVPGGVSVLELHFDGEDGLWRTDRSRAVDFSGARIGGTGGNCSGGITPWGTVLTAEEEFTQDDENGDGYGDLGWLTEIDVSTASVVRGEKLWAMGHLHHENATFATDERTVYYGDDGGSSGVYKFVADAPRDLSRGKLYGLRLDGPLQGREPTVRSGTWVLLPNTTKADRNATIPLAQSLGITNFDGVEDVEINPLTGQIYFAAKRAQRVYRFTDEGERVRDVETFVGGQDYDVVTPNGQYNVAWGEGNDNLIFDGMGNLWVMQDGGDNYIWMVRPTHSQAAPRVAIFARLPEGSEPTGLTFTPDYRFGFFSVQHPSDSNKPQVDATGEQISFTKSATVVFARAEHLGEGNLSTAVGDRKWGEGVRIYPSPTTGGVYLDIEHTGAPADYKIELHDLFGRRLGTSRSLSVSTGAGPYFIDLGAVATGTQSIIIVTVSDATRRVSRRVMVNR